MEINLFGRRTPPPRKNRSPYRKKTPEDLSKEASARVDVAANNKLLSQIDTDPALAYAVIEARTGVKVNRPVEKPRVSLKDRLETDLSDDVINAFKSDPDIMKRYIEGQLNNLIESPDEHFDEGDPRYYQRDDVSELDEKMSAMEALAEYNRLPLATVPIRVKLRSTLGLK